MKRLLLFVVAALLFSSGIFAQGKINPEAKARTMAEKLMLNDKAMEKFIPLYCEFQNALMLTRIPQTKAEAEGVNSDEAIDKWLVARFESRQQRLDVERKYYNEFKKILSMRQMKVLYDSPDWDQRPKKRD